MPSDQGKYCADKRASIDTPRFSERSAIENAQERVQVQKDSLYGAWTYSVHKKYAFCQGQKTSGITQWNLLA